MSIESINEEEKVIFKSLLNFFRTHKYDEKNKEIDGVLEEAITRIFQLEMKKMGLKYEPGKDNFKNDVVMKIISNPKKTLRGYQRKGATLDFNGKIIARKRPRVVYNKANLYKE